MLETAGAPITAKQLEDRNQERLDRAKALLQRLETDRPSSDRGVLSMLNDMHVEMSNRASECGICISMHPEKDVRDTAERLQREAFDGNLLDLKTARRYRDLILAPGGTKPAAELVRDFLGRPYDMRAFKAWLSPDRIKPA